MTKTNFNILDTSLSFQQNHFQICIKQNFVSLNKNRSFYVNILLISLIIFP